MVVQDNPAPGRYEALVDGEVAGSIYYRERDGALVLVHTEVADALAEEGAAH